MKPESPHPAFHIFSRDRQELRDPRQVAMKGRIKTSILRQPGKMLRKRIDQRDLPWQVGEVERLRAPQFIKNPWRDDLMINELDAPMHDSVPYRRHFPIAN